MSVCFPNNYRTSQLDLADDLRIFRRDIFCKKPGTCRCADTLRFEQIFQCNRHAQQSQIIQIGRLQGMESIRLHG